MARPPKHPGSVVAHVVALRLTEDEFRGLEELMRRQREALHTTGAGISIASFVRGLVRQALTAEGIEPGLLPPLPSPQAVLPLDLAKLTIPSPVAMPKVPDGAAVLLAPPSSRAPAPIAPSRLPLPPEAPPVLPPPVDPPPLTNGSESSAEPSPPRLVRVKLRGARGGSVEVVRRSRPAPHAEPEPAFPPARAKPAPTPLRSKGKAHPAPSSTPAPAPPPVRRPPRQP